jgi:hypothetical protein
MGLFLAATHGPKTRLTSQGEHALIRPWLWTLASDVGFYNLNAFIGSLNFSPQLKPYDKLPKLSTTIANKAHLI